jgi:hypothetical protein
MFTKLMQAKLTCVYYKDHILFVIENNGGADTLGVIRRVSKNWYIVGKEEKKYKTKEEALDELFELSKNCIRSAL